MTQMKKMGFLKSKWQHAFAVMVIGCVANCGCDRSGVVSGGDGAAKARPVSAWHGVGEGDSVVAVDDPHVQGELEAGIAKARQTMDAARERFNAASVQKRATWLIKWAAPIDVDSSEADGDGSDAVEYVWVMPINWSPFRVEGTLVSSPVHELTCGKAANDLVSFPVDELADWLVRTDAAQPNEINGGFTLGALNSKFGSPPLSDGQR